MGTGDCAEDPAGPPQSSPEPPGLWEPKLASKLTSEPLPELADEHSREERLLDMQEEEEAVAEATVRW